MTELTDTMLILKCKEKDTHAFRILVERYKKQAYSFAFSYLQNADDALNISQDAFIRTWKAMDTFIEGKHFSPWLFSIIKNLSINHLEKKKHLREISLDKAIEENGFDIADSENNPLDALEEKENRQQIWKVIFELKEEFREIIILKHFHDFSYQEIAETLSIPVGTVMSRLYYARLDLKERLKNIIQRNEFDDKQ